MRDYARQAGAVSASAVKVTTVTMNLNIPEDNSRHSMTVAPLPCPFAAGPLVRAPWCHYVTDDPDRAYLRDAVDRACASSPEGRVVSGPPFAWSQPRAR